MGITTLEIRTSRSVPGKPRRYSNTCSGSSIPGGRTEGERRDGLVARRRPLEMAAVQRQPCDVEGPALDGQPPEAVLEPHRRLEPRDGEVRAEGPLLRGEVTRERLVERGREASQAVGRILEREPQDPCSARRGE